MIRSNTFLIELFSVTPLPQPGNAKPRSFRLPEDRGIINRFGFNSEGAEAVKMHLTEYRREFGGRGASLIQRDVAENMHVSDTQEKLEEPQRSEIEQSDDESETDSSSLAKEKAIRMSQSITSSISWCLGWAWHKLMTPQHRTGVLGVNLGKNKTSDDEVGVSSSYGLWLICMNQLHQVLTTLNQFSPGLHPRYQRTRTLCRLSCYQHL